MNRIIHTRNFQLIRSVKNLISHNYNICSSSLNGDQVWVIKIDIPDEMLTYLRLIYDFEIKDTFAVSHK